eukprot:363256-Chlamydomonas_euryale.AAC.2
MRVHFARWPLAYHGAIPAGSCPCPRLPPREQCRPLDPTGFAALTTPADPHTYTQPDSARGAHTIVANGLGGVYTAADAPALTNPHSGACLPHTPASTKGSSQGGIVQQQVAGQDPSFRQNRIGHPCSIVPLPGAAHLAHTTTATKFAGMHKSVRMEVTIVRISWHIGAFMHQLGTAMNRNEQSTTCT